MARKYGGLTGPKTSITKLGAAGQWISPSEIYRERTADNWPITIPPNAVIAPVGSIVLAVSSGTVNAALDEGDFILASGAVLDRTADSSLFEAIGITFGNGDGLTTFGTPNLFQRHIYLKGAIASGIPITGSGQIGAQHIHLFTGFATNSAPPRNISVTDGKTSDGPLTNIGSSMTGEAIQNELRKKECVPLFSLTDAVVPVGCVTPLLWPAYNGAGFPVADFLICSGQSVSRSTYPVLFERLGTLYGSGNGSTTFTLPDYRGVFLSSSRQPPSVVQPSGGSNYLADRFANHTHNFTGGAWATNLVSPASESPGYVTGAVAPASSTSVGPSAESRTDNISVIWAIVAS
jgi:microcystin-dependent protein